MPTPSENGLHAAFDAIGIEQLRAGGGMKWTTFPDCIGAFVAEMDFGTAPAVSAALHEAIDRGRTGYPTAGLFHELAEATVGWQLCRYGWSLPPDAVQPVPDVIKALEVNSKEAKTPGNDEFVKKYQAKYDTPPGYAPSAAYGMTRMVLHGMDKAKSIEVPDVIKALEVMLRFYLPEGAPVVVPTPCYMPFVPLIEQLGHPAVQVPARHDGARWRFDHERIDAAFAAGARALLLCNPHNPLGRAYERAELERLAETVERHGARVFADEIHAPLVFDGRRHVPYATISPAAAAHSITTVSASKAWNLPGVKCAQLLFTRHDDRRTWHKLGHLLTSNSVSTLGIHAHIAAYRDGGAWLESVLGYLQGNRDLLTGFLRERLPRIGYAEPEGTYLAWLDCSALELPPPLGRWFRSAAKVAMTDGRECGVGFENYMRFNFAMPRPLLVQALEQIERAVAEC